MEKQLALRGARRGADPFRWFTSDEAVLAEEIARMIIPSDEDTPGMDEVGVFGPPAINAIDDLVVSSEYRQQVYSRGLLAFDTWAFAEHGRKFVELAPTERHELLKAAERIHEDRSAQVSWVGGLRRRLQAISQARSGALFASQLFPQIRRDCIRVFYTNQASWTWLEYDGPPMDKGYSPRSNHGSGEQA